jgi:hypothetical protein
MTPSLIYRSISDIKKDIQESKIISREELNFLWLYLYLEQQFLTQINESVNDRFPLKREELEKKRQNMPLM